MELWDYLNEGFSLIRMSLVRIPYEDLLDQYPEESP